MKEKMFAELTDAQEIRDNLEANSVEIEENYEYIKPFSDVELQEEQAKLSKNSVGSLRLNSKIKTLIEPLKEELKPIDKSIKISVKNLDQGGVTTYGRIYAFPDYDSKMMGLYDVNGILVGTRPLNRTERQLHINSNFNKASNE